MHPSDYSDQGGLTMHSWVGKSRNGNTFPTAGAKQLVMSELHDLQVFRGLKRTAPSGAKFLRVEN